MKKLTLIPITLTTLTPIVSMVGCSQANSFNLDHFKILEHIGRDLPILTTKNSVDLEAHTSYKAKIDTKKIKNVTITNKYLWTFVVVQSELFSPHEIDAQFEHASIKINNKPLEFVGIKDEPALDLPANQFYIYENNGWSRIFGGIGSVDNNTIVEINFEIKQPVSNFFPTFVLREEGY